MARTNVELKAHDADPDATLARCLALGAEDRGVLVQSDTYYAGRHGRLKLREQGADGDVLIAYRRADTVAAGESRYVLAPATAAAALDEALDAALGRTMHVAKHRRLLMWEHVRIHLDTVEGLGTFVEFEALVGPGLNSMEEAHEKVARLRAELEITDEALVAVGYADLLLDGPQALLRAAEAAMHNAYARYSDFKVGAAVRTASGAIYAGANMENVAFPVGSCAEQSALGAMVTAGERRITSVAVVAEKLEHCTPCGGCRQRLAEFATDDVPVYLGRAGREPAVRTLGELLPGGFTGDGRVASP